MRTVTSLCFAAVGGACLALFLLGVFVAGSASTVISIAALFASVLMLVGAVWMSYKADSAGCLTLLAYFASAAAFFGLLWASWD